MSAEPSPLFDRDNPEWTDEDFARARPASDLPPEILSQFPRTRGPQRAPKKVQVAIRLQREIVDHFKADGPGWHNRMEAVLRKAAGL